MSGSFKLGAVEAVADTIEPAEQPTKPKKKEVKWSELSYQEKLKTNPSKCNLETHYMWASNGSCHKKPTVKKVKNKPSTTTTKTKSVAPTAVASSEPVTKPVTISTTISIGYHDGNTYPHGECTWGVDHLIGVPDYLGNANQWNYSLPSHGYRTSGPTVNAVVVFNAGVHGAHSYYGHVAVVTSVNGDGTITVGESNFAGQRYITYRTIPVVSGMTFWVR